MEGREWRGVEGGLGVEIVLGLRRARGGKERKGGDRVGYGSADALLTTIR